MRRRLCTSPDSAIRMLGTWAYCLWLSHLLAVSFLPVRARAFINRSLSRTTRRRGETLRDEGFNESMFCASLASAYLFFKLATQCR